MPGSESLPLSKRKAEYLFKRLPQNFYRVGWVIGLMFTLYFWTNLLVGDISPSATGERDTGAHVFGDFAAATILLQMFHVLYDTGRTMNRTGARAPLLSRGDEESPTPGTAVVAVPTSTQPNRVVRLFQHISGIGNFLTVPNVLYAFYAPFKKLMLVPWRRTDRLDALAAKLSFLLLPPAAYAWIQAGLPARDQTSLTLTQKICSALNYGLNNMGRTTGNTFTMLSAKSKWFDKPLPSEATVLGSAAGIFAVGLIKAAYAFALLHSGGDDITMAQVEERLNRINFTKNLGPNSLLEFFLKLTDPAGVLGGPLNILAATDDRFILSEDSAPIVLSVVGVSMLWAVGSIGYELLERPPGQPVRTTVVTPSRRYTLPASGSSGRLGHSSA